MAVNWVGQPENANGRVVLTQQEWKIPGLRMFGKHHTHKAIPALCNTNRSHSCVHQASGCLVLAPPDGGGSGGDWRPT